MKALEMFGKKESKKQEESEESSMICCDLFSLIKYSTTQTHLWHLQTDNKAFHKAMNKYYDEAVDLLDRFMEVFLGHFPESKSKLMFHETGEKFVALEDADVREHFVEVTKMVDKTRKEYKDYPSIVNVLDDMDEFVNKVLYLITLK